MIENSTGVDGSIKHRFQVKRSYRWILELDGIDAFLLKECTRPAFELVNGERVYEPLKVMLYDPISFSATSQVYEWSVRLDRRDACLKVIDERGQDIERWNYRGALPMFIDFGKLDYADEYGCMIYLELEFENVELVC